MGAEDEVDALRTQPGGFGSPRDPSDVRVESGGAPHCFSRFDGHDANPSLGEQARRDAGSCPDICGDQPLGRAGAIENRLNRFGRVTGTIENGVGCSTAESFNRVAIVRLRHTRLPRRSRPSGKSL
jgi:hypothetical protein